jgi:L-histidine N-alpha-methyltransferase
MQNEFRTLAALPAIRQFADIAAQKPKMAPLFRADARLHFVEVLLASGREIVQTRDRLAEPEQGFQEIRTDEAGHAGDQPRFGRRLKLSLQILVNSHDEIKIAMRKMPHSVERKKKFLKDDEDGRIRAARSFIFCPSGFSLYKGNNSLVFGTFLLHKDAMSVAAKVTIHASQFPDNVRRDLFESLRTRQVNHKFHYDSLKQTQKWLALHQALSPSRTDPDCAVAYDHGFAALAARITAPRAHLIGSGCGGGQKDGRLLKLLRDAGNEVFYTPSDVSVAMVLTARQTAMAVIPAENCFPVVCDLASGDFSGQAAALSALPHSAARLITFLGMIPNFEPHVILPRLAGLLQSGDNLLLSANLAPGADYAAGVQRILPLYDNALTHDWLMTLLLDLGVESNDGELQFRIEESPMSGELKRVAAYFRFLRSRRIEVDAQIFEFHSGESIRLFFSYRHTPALVQTLLQQHGLRVLDQWITHSEEEGVFLVEREKPLTAGAIG